MTAMYACQRPYGGFCFHNKITEEHSPMNGYIHTLGQITLYVIENVLSW